MKRSAYFFFITLFFQASYICARASESPVSFNISKRNAGVGGLIKLSIKVAKKGIRHVDWHLCDSLLGTNNQVQIISSKIYTTNNGDFEKDIVITATKPCNLLLGAFPVIIQSGEGTSVLLTNSYPINFVAVKLPQSINDIRPIYSGNIISKNYYLSIVFFLVFIITLSIGLFYIRHRKKNKFVSGTNKKISLQRILLLEEEMNNDLIADKKIEDHIFEVFKDYLIHITGRSHPFENPNQSLLNIKNNPHLADQDKIIIIEILEVSQNIRFSDKYKEQAILLSFIASVKTFITNYPTSAHHLSL